jgi:hypothetical protein
MATTTPNFGWTVPTSSDLVKNGAVAIETLGDAIDASLLDLKGGTTGQVLSKASNTDMDFSWTTVAAGGGKILQVVFASTTTEVTNSTSTYSDTGCTVSITPSSASSRIMLIVNHNGWNKSSADVGNFIETQLLRGGTQVMFVSNGNRTSDQTLDLTVTQTLMYVDSPSTTSATTYKTQFKNGRNGAAVGINYGGSRSTIVALEIGA